MKIDKGRIINDFIEPNKRQYAIPVYQRNYEWSKEQCIKLFQDILAVQKLHSEIDKTHFCGSIIYAPLKEEHNIHYYIIIDGQQRLTTIYLLLKSLLDLAETDPEREAISGTLFNKDKIDTFEIDTASKLKLKPIKSDDNQLHLLMENRHKEMDKSSGIWQNYELFCTLVREQIAAGIHAKAIYRGVEGLTCASIRLEEEDNPQEIFERINSTGVPLSLSDKIRNFVLMTDTDQEILYEKYWLKTEQLLRKRNMTPFFLDYLNMKNDGFSKEEEAYEIFKTTYIQGNYTNESMLKEILHYAEFYHAFLYGEGYSPGVNALLKNLQKLKQTTVFLFLFRVFDDLEARIITEVELEKTLRFLLHYSIRRLICEVGSNTLRGLYKTLYSRVFKNEENKKHYYDTIVSFFIQLTSKDALIGDSTFRSALLENNLYRKKALCKFVLTDTENQGKEKLIVDNLTIEHIMPQNKNLSSAWQRMLGEEVWKEVQEKYVHTLGNLTLTGYNSEIGDKPFADKKNQLNEVQSKMVILNSDIYSQDIWNAETIQKRGERLADILCSHYVIEQPETTVTFSDTRYSEYNCANPDDATFKKPNYFVMQGELIKVNTFAEMLHQIISRLYQQDKTIIEELARKKVPFASWSKVPMFSYSEEDMPRNVLIDGTDIYRHSGLSAAPTISFIRTLLAHYDIEEDDFVYSACSTKRVENTESAEDSL
ncbi:MAG: DUF262 domain-containing protein [Methanocorpusculum sp.]|nr:DUF262 domain-containing protein [Methanocorpusculum sp.]